MAKTRSAAPPESARDDEYFQLVARALRVCVSYKPKFGQGRKGGLTLDSFRQMYGADPFYSWIGLDSPLMYAAHRAAGGMTSIYRQLGIGCQWLFHRLLQDQLGLSSEQADWFYEIPVAGKKARRLRLDGRIQLADVRDARKRRRLERWMAAVFDRVLLPQDRRPEMHGVVFEVRQGYKSKDAKRQNADISNATSAYAYSYVPVLLLLSTQIDSDVAVRYTTSRWLLLTGDTSGTPTESTYSFCRDVLGYDLAGFFARNSPRFRELVESVLAELLEAN